MNVHALKGTGMFSGLAETAEVFLVDDAALVHDENAVCIVLIQGFGPGHGRPATKWREAHLVNTFIECILQWIRRTQPTAHVLGRQQLPDVTDCPAHLREAEEIRVRMPDALVRRRWETLHPPKLGGITIGGRRKNLLCHRCSCADRKNAKHADDRPHKISN